MKSIKTNKHIQLFLNGLREESKDSKELIDIFKKGFNNKDITKEEEDFIHQKSKDVIKSLGLITIFVLPFGSFLLPFIIGWSKRLNIDIIPSNFKK